MYICINAVHGDLKEFIYEPTPWHAASPTGGEHFLPSGVIDNIHCMLMT